MGIFSLGLTRKMLATLRHGRAIFRLMLRGFFWILLFDERREAERLKNDLLRAEVVKINLALAEDIVRLMKSCGASQTELRRVVKELAVANMREHISFRAVDSLVDEGGNADVQRSGRRSRKDRRVQLILVDSGYSRRVDDAKT